MLRGVLSSIAYNVVPLGLCLGGYLNAIYCIENIDRQGSIVEEVVVIVVLVVVLVKVVVVVVIVVGLILKKSLNLRIDESILS